MKAFSCILMVMSISAVAFAQTTQPSLERGALEIRATQDFNSGKYASALPMLKRLADMSQDQPDQLGPIQEKIRVCERNLATNPAAAQQNSLTKGRTPHPAPKDGETLEITIKDLGNFDYDADHGGNIPEDVQKLSGHPIKLKGFMIPMDQAANITQFALVPDLFSCCFGQPPQIQHTVVVNCPKGKAVSYFPDEISVEGTLKVQEKKDEGFIVSIFEVEVSSVKPVAK
ncbi:MAG TPA: DUF3299 domain-containing protein [Tepidisphaeraceae bacterium]|jgi:hypothetical protein